MKSHFNPQELDLMKELFTMGMAGAADSLARMANCKVITQQVVVEAFDPQKKKRWGLGSKRKINVYTSHIKGDFHGVCFWLVGQRDTNRLSRFILPPSIAKQPSVVRRKMQTALMLEIDNVITAAVVTRMANLLGKMIYGNVPQHDNIERSQLGDFVDQESREIDPVLHAYSQYTVVDHLIQMEFHWYLPASFAQQLQYLHTQVGRQALLEKVI